MLVFLTADTMLLTLDLDPPFVTQLFIIIRLTTIS